MATILIVDDVSANREVLVALLGGEGHTLIEAADGDEGLLAVRSARPDLVITDVLMPVMDGFEFLRQLRMGADTATTPVVFYTAYYGEGEARALASAGGVSDVLTKPFEASEVLRVVSRVLSTESRTKGMPEPRRLTTTFEREHLRLVTDKLSEQTGDLKTANARLRALINIGLELASERDANRLLERVCLAVCDLFGATSVALGIVDPDRLVILRVVTSGNSEAADWIRPGDLLSGILRTVVVEKRTVRGDHTTGDLTSLPFPAHHPQVRTFLAAPIASPSQVYGWICLAGQAERTFTDNDEDLVTALSGLVGRIYENGQLVTIAEERAAALGREIAERQQAEAALRASERLNRDLVEHLPHRIVVKDCESVVRFCNANFAKELGLAPDAVIGRPTSAFHPAAIADAHTADDRNVMASGATKSVEEQHEVGGRQRWVHTVKVPYRDEHGDIIGVLALLEDITDRRTLEAQFQQSQKMEALGRLAASVAHDFNNLLTVILGLCELLLADLDVDDTVHRADVLEIQTAGGRAAGLTRQLLSFSRKQIIEPTLLDLNAIVIEMHTMLARLTRDEVTLEVKLQPGQVSVRADRGQLEQVIMNLAVNARDAMPLGGTLTIETAYVDLDADYAQAHPGVNPGAFVALTISDTGMGITPDVQARLFEPFFTTKDVGRGTGLGLATVQGIAARSGGSVAVHSEVGEGTSFTVYLPRVDADDAGAKTAAVATPQAAGSATILVVDDEEEIRELARRFLTRQGYTVLTAESADEASRLFDRQAIDLLLTDVVMPGAHGPDLTRMLLERHPTLKVVYMSGYTEDAIAQHGVLNPGITFVHKPFTSETLIRKIRMVLGE